MSFRVHYSYQDLIDMKVPIARLFPDQSLDLSSIINGYI